MQALSLCWRIAWRELLSVWSQSVVAVLLIAVGVASWVGTDAWSRSLTHANEETTRTQLQGDLRIAVGDLSAAQGTALAQLRERGVLVTDTRQAPAVASGLAGEALVTLMSVDPKEWPFYGGLTLEPKRPLADLLASADSVVVAPDLLDRLGLRVGDQLVIAGKTLTVAATIKAYPEILSLDRLPYGPRLLVSTEAGGRLSEQWERHDVLLKMPPETKATDLEQLLRPVFPGEGRITTTETAWSSFTSLLTNALLFFRILSALSFFVGALGVTAVINALVEQKRESAVVLRVLGTHPLQVLGIFTAQAVLLGVGGSLLGLGLGLGVGWSLPQLLAGLVPLEPPTYSWQTVLTGILFGVGVTLGAALHPLLTVYQLRPTQILRTPDERPSALRLFVEGVLLQGGVATAVLYALFAIATRSLRTSLALTAGLAIAFVALWFLTSLVARALRLIPWRYIPGASPVYYAVKQLQVTAGRRTAGPVTLALGLFVVTVVLLVQNGLLLELRSAGMQPGTPNLYLFGVKPTDRESVAAFLSKHPGVAAPPSSVSMAMASLVAINERSVPTTILPDWANQPFPVTTMDWQLGGREEIRSGRWFSPDDAGRQLLSLPASVAGQIGVGVGDRITLDLKGNKVTFEVISIRGTTGPGIHIGLPDIMGAVPGALDRFAETYVVRVQTKADAEGAVIRDISTHFSGLLPLGYGQLLRLAQSYLNRVAALVIFMTGFTLAAAAIILAASFAADQRQHRKEASIWRAVGASTMQVLIRSVSQATLTGVMAGLAGGAVAFTLIRLTVALTSLRVTLSADPVWMVTATGGILSMLAGAGVALTWLRVRPIQILKGE